MPTAAPRQIESTLRVDEDSSSNNDSTRWRSRASIDDFLYRRMKLARS